MPGNSGLRPSSSANTQPTDLPAHRQKWRLAVVECKSLLVTVERAAQRPSKHAAHSCGMRMASFLVAIERAAQQLRKHSASVAARRPVLAVSIQPTYYDFMYMTTCVYESVRQGCMCSARQGQARLVPRLYTRHSALWPHSGTTCSVCTLWPHSKTTCEPYIPSQRTRAIPTHHTSMAVPYSEQDSSSSGARYHRVTTYLQAQAQTHWHMVALAHQLEVVGRYQYQT